MPTPFMHLEVAERIRTHGKLAKEIVRQINRNCPAFYLGNVAADFQAISNIPREETHFYPLPPERGVQAHEVLLEQYPELAHPSRITEAHALFIAGYLVHLHLDLRWYWDVLIPYFVEAKDWPVDHRQRFLVHNTLLAYLDKLAFESLPAHIGETLMAAEPDDWLPFAGDGDLIRWRDMLVKQLEPGATIKTIEIYAERLKMKPEVFASNLENPQWMHEQVFRKVPLAQVQALITEAMEQGVMLVTDYLVQT